MRFGLPHTQARPDEVILAWFAWRVLSGHLNPGWFSYPSLLVYVLSVAYALYYAVGAALGWFGSFSAFLSTWTTDWSPFLLIARAVSVAAGVATVWIAYRLGTRAFDRRVGLVAAAALALAHLHVRDSHFGVTDTMMTFWVATAVLLMLRAAEVGTAGAFALSGIAAGLATGTKYSGAPLVIPGLIAALTTARGRGGGGAGWSREASKAALSFLAAMALGFLASTPFAALDAQKFISDLRLQRQHMVGGHGGIDLGPGWIYHATFSLRHGLGLPLLCAGIVGVPLALARRPRRAMIVLAFPLAHYLLAGSSLTTFVRYMMPVLPFLCVTAAVSIVWLADVVGWRLSPLRRAAVVVVLTAAAVAPSARAVISSDRLLARPDSRLLAGAWLRQWAEPGASIYQSGSTYGRLQPEADGARGYRHWQHRAEWIFEEQRRPADGLPDWIVIEESPLDGYSVTPPEVRALVEQRYELLRAFDAVDIGARNLYDQQDAFYLPYAGFERVRRPGPNFKIYRRRRQP